jgi:hypothetical protein
MTTNLPPAFVLSIGLFLLPLHADGQSSTSVHPTQNLIGLSALTKVGAEFWSAGGAGVAEVGLSTAPLANPAGAQLLQTTAFFEIGQRMPTTWLGGYDYDGQFLFPTYASVAFPRNQWILSAGYSNQYDLFLSLKQSLDVAQALSGESEVFTSERKVVVHSFFGSASFRPDTSFAIGLTLGVNYLTLSDLLWDASVEGSGDGLFVVAGGEWEIVQSVRLGGTVRLATTIKPSVDYAAAPLTPTLPRGLRKTGEGQPARPSYSASFPFIAEFGGTWDAFDWLNLQVSVEFQDWSSVSGGYRDQWQTHVGARVQASQAVWLSAGFFTAKEPAINTASFLNQNFVTGGVRWAASPRIVLDFSILDSHLFENQVPVDTTGTPMTAFHQTHMCLGVEYTF